MVNNILTICANSNINQTGLHLNNFLHYILLTLLFFFCPCSPRHCWWLEEPFHSKTESKVWGDIQWENEAQQNGKKSHLWILTACEEQYPVINKHRAIGGKFWMGAPTQFISLPTERIVNTRFWGQENSDTMPEVNSVFSGQMYTVFQSQESDSFFYNQNYLIIYLFFPLEVYEWMS